MEPSAHTTPISGFGPQASAAHGVVLRGGTQLVVHLHGPSFSEPHWFPLNVVPAGHTVDGGSAPHSVGSHRR